MPSDTVTDGRLLPRGVVTAEQLGPAAWAVGRRPGITVTHQWLCPGIAVTGEGLSSGITVTAVLPWHRRPAHPPAAGSDRA